jgi:hypothetical protein
MVRVKLPSDAGTSERRVRQALLLWVIAGRAGSSAEAGTFRSPSGVRRMRSPAGRPAQSRLPVGSGRAADSGSMHVLGSPCLPRDQSSFRLIYPVTTRRDQSSHSEWCSWQCRRSCCSVCRRGTSSGRRRRLRVSSRACGACTGMTACVRRRNCCSSGPPHGCQ